MLLKNKSIAIIGSQGSLGHDLVNYFSENNKVFGINKENYNNFINKKFDILINANGNSRRFWANQNIIKDFEASTLSVYKSLFDFKFDRYVYISSSDVYSNHANKLATKENQIIDTPKLCPYGFHKYLGEQLIKKYSKKYLILRCSMILGSQLKKGPIYDIQNNKPLFINKNSKIQMIDSQTIGLIIEKLVNRKIKNEIFNTGGNGIVNFKDIQTFFINKKIIFNKLSEKQIYEMNVNKLKRIFNLKSSSEYLTKYIENNINKYAK